MPGNTDGENQYATETLDGQTITIAWMPARESRDLDQIVPPDHYLMLSDNRDNARDSRYLGMIPRRNILGTVVATIR